MARTTGKGTNHGMDVSPLDALATGAKQFATSIANRVGTARDAASDRIDGVAEKIGDATESAGKRAGNAIETKASSLSELVKERPIMALAGAFALGWLLMKWIRR
jgi:hypothetical protein